MAYLKLIRSAPEGNAKNAAVRGKLYEATYDIFSGKEHLRFICPTLENAAYLIPPLIYPLTATYSPKFKRILPLVGQVSGRSGIRFHPGTRPEHSRGCILVGREAERQLKELILRDRETRLDISNENETRAEPATKTKT